MSEEDQTGDLGEAHDSKKGYGQILGEEIGAGVTELKRSRWGLLLSGLSAGLDVGFGPFLMVAVLTIMGGDFHDPATRLLVSAVYPVGFVFVVIGRSELFTEHTTLAVLPVLARRGSIQQLARLWGLVYIANVAGTLLFAFIVEALGASIHSFDDSAARAIGRAVVDNSWLAILASGVLAGWLMGLLSWLVTACQETISRIVVVWIVTAGIAVAGLHHSIAGSVEVLLGLLARPSGGALAAGSAAPAWSDYARVLSASSIGNAIGGLVFVAVIKYAHATRETRSAA